MQALAVILREVRLAEFVALACVRYYDSDCTTIYTRECEARHMTPERYHYLYAHYGERWARRLTGRIAYMRFTAQTHREGPRTRMCDLDFRNNWHPSRRGIVQNEHGMVGYELFTGADAGTLHIPMESDRLFNITHVTVFYETDRPIGDILSLRVTTGEDVILDIKTYRFPNDGRGYVRIPLLDGHTGFILGECSALTPCVLRSNDVHFGARAIATGNTSFGQERETHYWEHFGAITFMAFLTHPRYAHVPIVPGLPNNAQGVFTGENTTGDATGILWNVLLYAGVVAVRYTRIPDTF